MVNLRGEIRGDARGDVRGEARGDVRGDIRGDRLLRSLRTILTGCAVAILTNDNVWV